jgi:hypothetical protein
VQRETLQITGLATDFFTTAAAQRQADRMLRACREQVRRGNRYALTELLDDNPAFILVEWVHEMYMRLLKGGLPLRRPGRTRGKHMVNPLVIRALVDCLVERQEVPNRGGNVSGCVNERRRCSLRVTTTRTAGAENARRRRHRP